MSSVVLNKRAGVRQSCFAAASLLLLSTAACNRQAASGQTVAVVNGDAITASELKQELGGLPAASREQAKAQVLQAMIDRRLLAKDGEAQKLDRTPAFVLAERRMREVMLAQQVLQGYARSSRQPISQTEVNTYLDRHPNIGADRKVLIVNQIQFPTPAKPLLETLKSAGTMDQMMALLQQRQVPIQRGRTQVDTALINDATVKQLSGLQPGEPLLTVNGPTSVASVVAEQQPAPLSAKDQALVARRRIETERARTAAEQRSESLRQSAEISYAKGYGPAAAQK